MGAQWVVLPELFATGIAFDDCMLDGHRALDGEPMQMLKDLAAEVDAIVGGSYLAEFNGHVYNTFALANSDGQVFTHDKDFPSGPVEHAYYAGEDAEFVCLLRERDVPVRGDIIPSREQGRDGVLPLRGINFGVALCWDRMQHFATGIHGRRLSCSQFAPRLEEQQLAQDAGTGIESVVLIDGSGQEWRPRGTGPLQVI